MSVDRMVDDLQDVCDSMLKDDTRPFYLDNDQNSINDFKPEYDKCKNLDKDSILELIFDKQTIINPTLGPIQKYKKLREQDLRNANSPNKIKEEINNIKERLNIDNYNEIVNNYDSIKHRRKKEERYKNSISINKDKLNLNLRKEKGIKFHAQFHFFLAIMLLILFLLLLIVYFLKL